MREIKFRVWGVQEKKYFSWDIVKTWQGLGFVLSGENQYYIPEEYTGREDKNGKEIYEGDRIGNFYNVVEYLNGGFCINGDRPLSMFTNQEIVGNINENPKQ